MLPDFYYRNVENYVFGEQNMSQKILLSPKIQRRLKASMVNINFNQWTRYRILIFGAQNPLLAMKDLAGSVNIFFYQFRQSCYVWGESSLVWCQNHLISYFPITNTKLHAHNDIMGDEYMIPKQTSSQANILPEKKNEKKTEKNCNKVAEKLRTSWQFF